MTFQKSIEVILKWEGGYTNDPSDPGGETNFGIAKKFYPKLDIKNLQKTEAIDIYRNDYWIKRHCDDIPMFLRLAYFDCVVNQGPGAAVRLLQRAIGIKEDMVFGPLTQTAVSKSGQDLLPRFLAERALHYAKLEIFPTFGKGWMRRLMDVAVESGKTLM